MAFTLTHSPACASTPAIVSLVTLAPCPYPSSCRSSSRSAPTPAHSCLLCFSLFIVYHYYYYCQIFIQFICPTHLSASPDALVDNHLRLHPTLIPGYNPDPLCPHLPEEYPHTHAHADIHTCTHTHTRTAGAVVSSTPSARAQAAGGVHRPGHMGRQHVPQRGYAAVHAQAALQVCAW